MLVATSKLWRPRRTGWHRRGCPAAWWAVEIALCAAWGACWTGCGGGTPAGDEAKVRAAMRMVGIEYGRYQGAHNGQPPADEAAFRGFLDQQIRTTPNYGVKSADELLAMTRDGQPLHVIYGGKIGPPDQPDEPWAACEAQGDAGKRLVVNTRGSVVELSSDEVERILKK